MANKIIFSIHIDIPVEKLDNPAGFDWKTGEQEKTDKSLKVKKQFSKYFDKIKQRQEEYAKAIGVKYTLHGDDQQYQDFVKMFREEYPQISEYDIINFYKHWLMKEYTKGYDQICYIDFDVIPNTTESIFAAFDLKHKFVCAEQNDDALWGKYCKPDEYTTCIRNPASKYWNAHALLSEEGLDPDTDVFNTGIMAASSKIIRKLDYFGNFKAVLDLMSQVKNEQFSMYPKNIQRVFNYDNETVFSFKRIVNDVHIDYMTKDWHYRLTGDYPYVESSAKMYHVIHKRFEELL